MKIFKRLLKYNINEIIPKAAFIFDTHHNNEDIKTVPQAFEVMQSVDADFQHLLHHVVEDEEAERHFTHTNKVIPAGHISYQTHRLELPRGHHPTSSRELHQQPDKSIKYMCSYNGISKLEQLVCPNK